METIRDTDAVTAFAALAQGSRLAIYRLLAESGPDGMTAGAIAEALGIPAPTLSFHLAQLRQAGLVLQRRDSRQLIYAINVSRMNDLIGYLTDRCCGGRPELCAPTAKRNGSHGERAWKRKAV